MENSRYRRKVINLYFEIENGIRLEPFFPLWNENRDGLMQIKIILKNEINGKE